MAEYELKLRRNGFKGFNTNCQSFLGLNLVGKPTVDGQSEEPTLIMTNPPLRRAEHCMGKVADAPASAPEKSY